MSTSKRTPLLIIFVTVFIDLLGFGIVLPLLPRYATAFDATKAELGMLMASFSAMQFLFAPLWGRLSDRIGRRPVLLVGLAGSTIFYGMFGYVMSLGVSGDLSNEQVIFWLLISRIGAGIAGATISTSQAYIADATDRQNRTKGMALIGAAFGIGFTFGPLIGAMFVSTELDGAPDPRAGYVASVLSGLALLWAIFKLPESLKPGESDSAGHFHLKHIGTALSNPSSLLLLLTIFLTTFAFAQFETTLSLLTRTLNAPDRENFFIFAYVGLVLTLSQGLIVRRMATRMPAQRLALIGTAVMVVGLLLIGYGGTTGSKSLLYWFIPIAVVGFSATTPSLQSLLSLRTSSEKQGQVLGLGQSMSAMARILGPLASMQLFDQTHVAWPYWCGAALMGVALVLIGVLRNPGGDEAEPSQAEPSQPSESQAESS